ncbi:hypothetical protein [Nocardia sp. NPDC052566]|uniref:hypothetical protein n=1 Tax=Nocardia sp. NPDC052566 TaxID=3364330 RepID=UPI0037C84A21
MTVDKYLVVVKNITTGVGRTLVVEPDGINPVNTAHQVAAYIDEMLNSEWEVEYVEPRTR